MYVVRDIMYCKPGQVRAMVEKFQKLNTLGSQLGMGTMRIMTDVATDRYWTVVAESDIKNLEEHQEMMRKAMQNKDFQEAMKGYHDLVAEGRREIYTLES
jgi:hypothetical protein